MSDMDESCNDDKAPLEWIQLELIPLPHISDEPRLLLWWNPGKRELRGDGKDKVLLIVEQALRAGKVENAGTVYEVTDPLTKPSELAVVLAKSYWVVPQPVRYPGESTEQSEQDLASKRLQ
ncbi:hypothetical protein J3998_10695 [Thiomicrorhabdus sp. 6S2-11]|uniref:Uncharacterized protein n=1 Tax=Thiomicrorhabdus marina TaxID=2818442 RepID=A0ABS3Q7J0_9GAMM|nr:hypothetical protein [Thiomicrorhabdus marina]MBO1928043.1 hypothetical protein [Thiomicrorhabdus marina]